MKREDLLSAIDEILERDSYLFSRRWKRLSPSHWEQRWCEPDGSRIINVTRDAVVQLFDQFWGSTTKVDLADPDALERVESWLGFSSIV